MNDCKHYDKEFGCCKLLSDWSYPMPVLQPCVESPCKDYSRITNYERIKTMSIDELAEQAVFVLVRVRYRLWVSRLDSTVHITREKAIAHNKEWLNREVEKERENNE